MRYTVEISQEDYIAANYFALRRRILWISVISVLVLVFLAVIHRRDIFAWIFGAIELLMIWCIGYFLFLPWYFKRIYKQYKVINKPCEYEFTEYSFDRYSEYGNTTIPWGVFHKWRENKKVFLVYATSNLYYLIPKRIFNTVEEEQSLRDILTKALGAAR